MNAPARQEHEAVRRISQEASAAKSLIESLRAMGEDDAELVAGMVEGETSLFEAIDILLGRILETKALLSGTESVMAELQARRERFETRVGSLRAMIEQAFAVAEIETSVERPLATLSMARRQPKVEIADEAAIPADYWKAADPKLDKKALLDALKSGLDVPGAYLGNAAPTLTLRTK